MKNENARGMWERESRHHKAGQFSRYIGCFLRGRSGNTGGQLPFAARKCNPIFTDGVSKSETRFRTSDDLNTGPPFLSRLSGRHFHLTTRPLAPDKRVYSLSILYLLSFLFCTVVVPCSGFTIARLTNFFWTACILEVSFRQ